MLAVGIPYVLTFYLMLAALEDSGYLTSAAVLMDRVFGALGLPGRAAIPLLAAAGCNVPAIYGTRVLRTRRERVLASFLVTLTPCSARSAVVIAALAAVRGRAGRDRGVRRRRRLAAIARRPRRQRDDPGPPAVARPRAGPAARADPAPRGRARPGGGSGASSSPRRRSCSSGRSCWGSSTRRGLAGHRGRHRAGDRVAPGPAGDRGRRDGLRVPAQGARAPAAAGVRGRRAGPPGVAGRAHGPVAAVRLRGGVEPDDPVRRDARGPARRARRRGRRW